MTRSIYVAGASAEVDMVADYADTLIARGWEITFRWFDDVRAKRAAGIADHELDDRERSLLAGSDIKGVRDAEVFWLIIPPKGRSEGCWLELGAALQASKRVIVSGDWRRSIFTSLALACCDTHAAALEWIGEATK